MLFFFKHISSFHLKVRVYLIGTAQNNRLLTDMINLLQEFCCTHVLDASSLLFLTYIKRTPLRKGLTVSRNKWDDKNIFLMFLYYRRMMINVILRLNCFGKLHFHLYKV